MKMKNINYLIICIIFSFLGFTTSVNALENNTMIFDYDNVNINNSIEKVDGLKEKLTNIMDLLNQNNFDYYVNIVYSFGESISNLNIEDIDFRLIDNKDTDKFHFYSYLRSNTLYFRYSADNVNSLFLNLDVSNNLNFSYSSIVDFINTNIDNPNFFQNTNLDTFTVFNYNNSQDFDVFKFSPVYNFNYIYYSSFDIKIKNRDTPFTIKIKKDNNYTILNEGDNFIPYYNSKSIEKKPILQFKEVNHTLNNDKTYKTKTIDFSFDIFDTKKYKYYWSNDNVMFFDFKGNQVRVTFNENTTIHFKVTDLNGNTIETYFYELKDINKTKYLDPSLDLTGKGLPSLSDSSYEDELNDDSETVNGYIERFKKYFVDKFIIIEQFQKIYEKWSSYDPYYSPDRSIVATVRCARYGDVVYKPGGDAQWCDIVWSSDYKNKIPRLHIDLSFVNLDYDFEIVDMGVLLKHRDDYFKWIYLSLGSFTCFKVLDRVIKIIRGFKHGR